MSPTVHVEEEALDALRVAVLNRHGILRGRLKDEATRALRLHVDRLEQEAQSND